MGWAAAPIMRALNLRLNGRASSGPVSNSYNPRDSTEILKYFSQREKNGRLVYHCRCRCVEER
jgi:hypothetical protein